MGEKEICGYGEIIEGISHTVGEATNNEERYTEEGGENVALARKGNGRGHDESATYGEESTTEGTYGKATFKYRLS